MSNPTPGKNTGATHECDPSANCRPSFPLNDDDDVDYKDVRIGKQDEK